VSLIAPAGPMSAAVLAADFPPTPGTFWQPWVVFGEIQLFGMDMTLAITRPMVVLTLSMLLIGLWLHLSTRRVATVPGKSQWFTEQVHGFVRNGVARDMIGSQHYLPYVPFLFSLFVVILFNNWAGIIPPVNLPTFGRVGMAIALVLIVYVLYHAIGFRRHGFLGYFKFMVPAGLPVAVIPFVFILELMTFFITRPLTLSLRLFGNMFAGHMLVLVVTLGAWELFTSGGLMTVLAFPTWIGALLVFVFEALIQAIQAYVFILLTASYIGAALADDH
jgi:F-type H+-transporting ATPase subunit a